MKNHFLDGSPAAPQRGREHEAAARASAAQDAAVFALLRLQGIVAHIHELFPACYVELSYSLEWIDAVEAALLSIRASMNAGQWPIDIALHEGSRALANLLERRDLMPPIDDDDKMGQLAASIVEYWVHDVLRLQCQDFLLLLDKHASQKDF
jgi:hypothetical protein